MPQTQSNTTPQSSDDLSFFAGWDGMALSDCSLALSFIEKGANVPKTLRRFEVTQDIFLLYGQTLIGMLGTHILEAKAEGNIKSAEKKEQRCRSVQLTMIDAMTKRVAQKMPVSEACAVFALAPATYAAYELSKKPEISKDNDRKLHDRVNHTLHFVATRRDILPPNHLLDRIVDLSEAIDCRQRRPTANQTQQAEKLTQDLVTKGGYLNDAKTAQLDRVFPQAAPLRLY